jgi:hypothetical protein
MFEEIICELDPQNKTFGIPPTTQNTSFGSHPKKALFGMWKWRRKDTPN